MSKGHNNVGQAVRQHHTCRIDAQVGRRRTANASLPQGGHAHRAGEQRPITRATRNWCPLLHSRKPQAQMDVEDYQAHGRVATHKCRPVTERHNAMHSRCNQGDLVLPKRTLRSPSCSHEPNSSRGLGASRLERSATPSLSEHFTNELHQLSQSIWF